MTTTKATRTRTSATRASGTVPKAAIRATRTTATGRTTRTAGLPATRDVETTSAKQHHGRSLGDLPTLHRVGPGDDHGGVAVSSASVDRIAGRGCPRLRGLVQSADRVAGAARHQTHLRARAAFCRAVVRHIAADLPDRPSTARAARPDRARGPASPGAIDRPAATAGCHGPARARTAKRRAAANLGPHRQLPGGWRAPRRDGA